MQPCMKVANDGLKRLAKTRMVLEVADDALIDSGRSACMHQTAS